MKREEVKELLNDFIDYTVLDVFPLEKDDVEDYLNYKFINSSPYESQNVVDNEVAKEDCPECGSNNINIRYNDGDIQCIDCGYWWAI